MVVTKRGSLSGGAVSILAAMAASRFGSVSRAAETFEVTHSDAEWRKRLTPAQYAVLRESETERPFTSPLLHEDAAARLPARAATSTCSPRPRNSTAARVGQASGRRWKAPSARRGTRPSEWCGTAVHCRRCGGHLGHVFDDGPKPTGLRYCMNGVALGFKPTTA